MATGRRVCIGKGTMLVARIHDDDPVKLQVEITSANLQQASVTCRVITDADNVDYFSGGLLSLSKGKRLLASLRDVITGKVCIKLLIKGHAKNSDKDHVIVRSDKGLGTIHDQVKAGGDGSNSGGSPEDPDAEGFVRSGTGTGNVAIAAGTTGNKAGAIQPGTVTVRKTGTNDVFYDYFGQIFKIDDANYVVYGNVVYDNTSGYWSVTMLDGAFAGDMDALKVG